MATALFSVAAALPAPAVTGPRTTTSERPVYRFRSKGAKEFRCAFDGSALHFCRPTYSERLAPGSHVLRVRAIAKGRKSPVASIRIVVTVPYTQLVTSQPAELGPGAGVAAADETSVWVPLTETGEVLRVDRGTGSVGARIHAGEPANGRAGLLDASVLGAGSVWTASDGGATISQVDAATNALVRTIPVKPRPGGLAFGDGGVWAFHFLTGDVTRVDAATGAVRTFTLPNVAGTGIAYGAGTVWLLATNPARILRLDPATGATVSTTNLQAPFARVHTFLQSWWLAFGDGAVWATLPDPEAVARLDATTGAVTYARTPYGRPFGVAVGGGSAWVATDHGVLRYDETTAAITGAALLPTANGSGFASIAYGGSAAWFTNYDRGTLTAVTG
jgi:streptogramin lyase